MSNPFSSFIWWCWCRSTPALIPLMRSYLKKRTSNGKEIASRLEERFGSYQSDPKSLFSDPTLPLIVIRAPSVGETRIALLIAESLQETKSNFLICSNTVDSARLMEQHTKDNVQHVFTPLDIRSCIQSFLSYWNPSLILHVENEIWPVSLLLSKQKSIPLGLINGRVSDRSWKRYKHFRWLFTPIFSTFSFIQPRLYKDQGRLEQLTTSKVISSCNLKQFLASQTSHKHLADMFKGRNIFLAASTHAPEEQFIVKSVLDSGADLCLIVPRHPSRGEELSKELGIKLYSKGEYPTKKDRFFIIDEINILDQLYPLSEFVFIGNSLSVPGGGHNFYEPLHYEKPISIGPHFQNWEDAVPYIGKGITVVKTETDLAKWINAEKKPPKALTSGNMDGLLREIRSYLPNNERAQNGN